MKTLPRRKQAFSECMLRAIEFHKRLPPDTRTRLTGALRTSVDLAVLARELDEEYSSEELANDLRSCAPHAGQLQFTAHGQILQLADIHSAGPISIKFAGGEAGAHKAASTLSALLQGLSNELRPNTQPQSVVFTVLKAGVPLGGAKLTLRADGSRVRNRACFDARSSPKSLAELWAGSPDPCLDAVADQNGSAEFLSDAPVTGYKLSVFAPGTDSAWVHYASLGLPVAPRVAIDFDETDASAWEDLPSEPLPSCGEASALAKLVTALPSELRAGLEDASVLVDDQGQLSEPDGVSKSAWLALRYARLEPPKSCKPGRVALPSSED
jgi:hypothetical protein